MIAQIKKCLAEREDDGVDPRDLVIAVQIVKAAIVVVVVLAALLHIDVLHDIIWNL